MTKQYASYQETISNSYLLFSKNLSLLGLMCIIIKKFVTHLNSYSTIISLLTLIYKEFRAESLETNS